MPQVPAESVDAFAGAVHDPEQGRDRIRPLFQAACVMAVVAWMTTFVVGAFWSESKGIFASWCAIFPTAFGGAGLRALDRRLGVWRAIAVALLAGIVGSVGLWLFFVGVWPAL